MKSKLIYIAILLLWLSLLHVRAQDSFEEFRNRANASYGQFRKQVNDDYEAFRKKVNDEYAAMVENSWKGFSSIGKRPVPDDKVKPVPPVVYPKEDENKPAPKPKPLPYDDVVEPPKPKPQPTPIAPIEEKPAPSVPERTFYVYGTRVAVHFDLSNKVELKGVCERDVAQAWRAMSSEHYTNLLGECLKIRKEKKLCDWAYLAMLRKVSEEICGQNTNSATLMMAYLYCQSGYKMRLARDRNNVLYMMYASDYIIFGVDQYTIDGMTYYPYNGSPKSVYMCDVSFPQEKAMSMSISKEQQLASIETEVKTRQSSRYPEVKTSMRSNKNLMAFYENYPTAMIGDGQYMQIRP